MHNYSELISSLRDYKLKVINGDVNFNLSKSITNDIYEKLDFIIETFPDDVISGSFSLRLLGLITRTPNDIDIVISNGKRYDKYLVGDYDEEIFIPNRLGIRSFKYKRNFFSKERDYEVDFFEDKNPVFLTLSYKRKLIKIHNPIEVIQLKLDILKNSGNTSTSQKHKNDLTVIFGLKEKLEI